MKKIFSKAFWQKSFKILKATFSGFAEDKGPKLSASLAYTTVFSLGPMLLLIISLASVFFGQEAIEGQVYGQLNSLIGDTAAKQVQDIIRNIQFTGKTRFALIASIVTLLIGATSLFIEIQDSLNTIWKVKAKPKKGWVKFLKNRLLSSSLIVSLGFLLVVSLVINAGVDAMAGLITRYFSSLTTFVITAINLVITFIIISFLFAIIFKVLPDVKIKWKDVKTGAIFTAVLFIIGKFVIGLYIAKSATGSAYGAAGSIIIILVWIYYTSMILYLGAEFTQVYSEAYGGRILPADYAVHVEQKEIEKDVAVLPVQHPEVKG